MGHGRPRSRRPRSDRPRSPYPRENRSESRKRAFDSVFRSPDPIERDLIRPTASAFQAPTRLQSCQNGAGKISGMASFTRRSGVNFEQTRLTFEGAEYHRFRTLAQL